MERTKTKRAALITAGALGIAAALIVVLMHTAESGPSHKESGRPAAPKIPVAYTVDGTGTAQITYTQGAGSRATTITAQLPWRQTSDVAVGKAPATVSIVLDQHGGQATCTLTVRGHAVQHATAYGTFGRATCSAPLTAS